MIAVLGQKTGVFLYDNIENARKCKQEGLLGWIFWSEKVFDILEPMVDICLIEKNENAKDFIESDLKRVKKAFQEVKVQHENRS